MITRFAPSPTGLLHIGHAHAALFAERAAGPGGKFLLRIEDIDATRCREAFVHAILDDLGWLGLIWDGEVRRQSRHMDDYRRALERLDGLGVLYPCFCTRAEIKAEIARAGAAPHGPEGALYPGTCRALGAGERRARIEAGRGYALRLDAGKAVGIAGPLEWRDRGRGVQRADAARFGDAVLARKETPTSYHLSVAVDDAIQGVTLVTRGEDLFEATHIHRLLQALLGLPVPEYRHHGLIRDRTGARLAKREGAPSIRALRDAGKTPDEARALAGFPA
jgi:glutamyl-Q tRNA(Asp) synthetase